MLPRRCLLLLPPCPRLLAAGGQRPPAIHQLSCPSEEAQQPLIVLAGASHQPAAGNGGACAAGAHCIRACMRLLTSPTSCGMATQTAAPAARGPSQRAPAAVADRLNAAQPLAHGAAKAAVAPPPGKVGGAALRRQLHAPQARQLRVLQQAPRLLPARLYGEGGSAARQGGGVGRRLGMGWPPTHQAGGAAKRAATSQEAAHPARPRSGRRGTAPPRPPRVPGTAPRSGPGRRPAVAGLARCSGATCGCPDGGARRGQRATDGRNRRQQATAAAAGAGGHLDGQAHRFWCRGLQQHQAIRAVGPAAPAARRAAVALWGWSGDVLGRCHGLQ